jgi:pimeloyl-ACP methyl ester carboxylesterase
MIHVESGGRGGVFFLLLHGLGATAAVWSDVGARLADRGLGRWSVVDLPGHGASARCDSYSIGRFAADLAPLAIDESAPVFLVGHSLGAYIALALASAWFGVRPAGVLGIGPKITWTEADLQGVRELAAKPARRFATEDEALARYRKVSGLDARFARPEHLARGVARSDDGYALAADPRTMLVAGAPFATLARSATCPVILARGEHDPMVTLAELAAHAPTAVELAGRGHNAHVEDPDSVVDLCVRLLESR